MTDNKDETATGIVEYVGYYQTEIGRPDRCVVFLRVNHRMTKMLVFDADVRDQFPAGREVQVRYRRSVDNTSALVERKLL